MSSFRVYQYNRPETWTEHYEDFESWIDGKGAISPIQKRGLFLDTIDATTKRNLKKWMNVQPLRGDITYQQIVDTLDQHIVPSVNKLVAYSTFINRKQQPSERAATFMAALETLSEPCGFGAAAQVCILGQFVAGLRDRQVQTTLLSRHSNLDTTSALQQAELVEQAEADVVNLRQEDAVDHHAIHRVESCARNQERHSRNKDRFDEHHYGNNEPDDYRPRNHDVYKAPKASSPNPTSERRIRCFRCGDQHYSKLCPKPWQTFKCDKCLKMGHLARVCMAGSARRRSKAPANRRDDSNQPSTSTNTGTHHVALEYPDSLFMVEPITPSVDEDAMRPIIVTLQINGKSARFELDTGATYTLISLRTFNSLFSNTVKPAMQQSSVVL